eukprot:jgi/Picre1/34061/NNA_001536.t1
MPSEGTTTLVARARNVDSAAVDLGEEERRSKVVGNVAVMGAIGCAAAFALLRLDSNPWEAYQAAVKMNPIETKACISGIVYSFGDLIAQNYEGRDISDWIEGGYPIIKVGIDQTVWSLFWNSTYYVLLGILKAESPKTIVSSVQQSWWDLLRAGWRLWPIVHICTYGIIPVQHRLLFVDAVELVWVCILSTYGQQQREARGNNPDSPSWVACALPGQAGEGGDPAEEIIRGMESESQVVFDVCGETVVKSPEQVYSEVEA